MVALPTKGSRDVIEVSRSWNPLKTWTDQGLLFLLNRFLNEKPANISLCAFIDGLDEFVGDEEYLLHMIDLFNKSPRCKICVSSRPEQAFRQEFRLCPQLRVQDLNRKDIEQMAAGRLIPSLQRRDNMPTITEDKVLQLVKVLVKKASGVFLWLDLMIKDLIRGSKNGDTFEELELRLARTPDTINGLYAHMLQKLDPLYVEECVRYCRVLITAEKLRITTPISLLTLALAEGEPWNHLVDFDLAYFAESRFNSLCQVLESRLTSRCGGLLEVDNHSHEEADQEATIPYFDRKVDFVHKTAMEYVEKVYGTFSLGSSALLESKALIARGMIGTYIISDTGYNLYDTEELPWVLKDSMLAISTMSISEAPSDNDGPAKSLQIGLVDQACRMLQNLYTFHNASSAEQHFFDDPSFLECLVISCSGEKDILYNPLKSPLGIAAFFGCHHYVQSCLLTETFSSDRMSDILQAALLGFDLFMSYYSTSIPWLSTIQAILRYHVDPDLNKCCLELTQKLLSIGANPNTRLAIKYQIDVSSGHFLCQNWMDLSPLAFMEHLRKGNAEIEACLRAAGGIHYKRVRFAQYEGSWYPVTEIQSQRLNQLLIGFGYGSAYHLWTLSSESDGPVREGLESIAENDTISEEDMITEIEQSDESF
ncbi:MAG: hypothetical protein Q9184_005127 [Pyrenodesmia sp. 2 TL-2023]